MEMSFVDSLGKSLHVKEECVILSIPIWVKPVRSGITCLRNSHAAFENRLLRCITTKLIATACVLVASDHILEWICLEIGLLKGWYWLPLCLAFKTKTKNAVKKLKNLHHYLGFPSEHHIKIWGCAMQSRLTTESTWTSPEYLNYNPVWPDMLSVVSTVAIAYVWMDEWPRS